jgi:hypothetical protein
MWNLETAQVVWEKLTKKFENTENSEKKKWFNDLIDNLEKNKKIETLKEKRESLTEDQKLKLYNKDAITIWTQLKRRMPIVQIIWWTIDDIKNIKERWYKNAFKYDILKKLPCRFLVELGILKKPEWVWEEKLIEDVKKDAKNFDIYLWLCNTVCMVVPEGRVAVPFIWMAKKYSWWYKNHWTEVVKDRLERQKKEQLTNSTKKELTEVLSNKNDLNNQNL